MPDTEKVFSFYVDETHCYWVPDVEDGSFEAGPLRRAPLSDASAVEELGVTIYAADEGGAYFLDTPQSGLGLANMLTRVDLQRERTPILSVRTVYDVQLTDDTVLVLAGRKGIFANPRL